jgi:hypothetical protein
VPNESKESETGVRLYRKNHHIANAFKADCAIESVIGKALLLP